MDAFVIRGTLVPAFMRLAGRANWWLPSWLEGTWERLRIRDEAPMAAAEPELVLAEAASGELDKVWEMRR